MRIGYVKGKKNTHSYREQMQFLDKMNLDKIYHDKDNGNIELSKMSDYTRKGDKVFIYSIENMGHNIKSTVRFIMDMVNNDVELIIRKEKVYTGDKKGKYALSIISALNNACNDKDTVYRNEANSNRGRLPRELEDLAYYKKQVENKNITVAKACAMLNIGKTTYYRKIKQLESGNKEGADK